MTPKKQLAIYKNRHELVSRRSRNKDFARARPFRRKIAKRICDPQRRAVRRSLQRPVECYRRASPAMRDWPRLGQVLALHDPQFEGVGAPLHSMALRASDIFRAHSSHGLSRPRAFERGDTGISFTEMQRDAQGRATDWHGIRTVGQFQGGVLCLIRYVMLTYKARPRTPIYHRLLARPRGRVPFPQRTLHFLAL